MTTILVDHNIEGQAVLLAGTLLTEDWLDLAPIRIITFTDVRLPLDSSDRNVWRFVQAEGMLPIKSGFQKKLYIQLRNRFPGEIGLVRHPCQPYRDC